ncbi:hypothetical protein DRP77_06995 [Candidatus Poribacteria bacterium]|nr:MAG: hypothetical protein DRP77_06995 [Candidatus Poribacteria bacterium]
MSLRVGIVGCGNVAMNRHAPAFAKIEGVEIVAACDLVEEKARALASRYGARWYTNLDEMLEKEELDLVDVVTRETDRAEPLIKCLRAGKHVFCEKPLVGKKGQFCVDEGDLEEARRVIDEWVRAGTSFGINFNYRTAPHAVKLKRLIDEGELGEPVLINVFAHLACWSHVIDLMRWFNGEVEELTAYMSGPEHARDRSATLRFGNGSIGTLVGTVRLGWHHPLLRIEVVGTRGRAVIEDLCGSFTFYPSDRREVISWSQPVESWRAEFALTFERSIRNFVSALMEGREPPVTGWDALREIEIDAAIPISARRGGPVRIEHYRPQG